MARQDTVADAMDYRVLRRVDRVKLIHVTILTIRHWLMTMTRNHRLNLQVMIQTLSIRKFCCADLRNLCYGAVITHCGARGTELIKTKNPFDAIF